MSEPKRKININLRMSDIGLPERQLWLSIHEQPSKPESTICPRGTPCFSIYYSSQAFSIRYNPLYSVSSIPIGSVPVGPAIVIVVVRPWWVKRHGCLRLTMVILL